MLESYDNNKGLYEEATFWANFPTMALVIYLDYFIQNQKNMIKILLVMFSRRDSVMYIIEYVRFCVRSGGYKLKDIKELLCLGERGPKDQKWGDEWWGGSLDSTSYRGKHSYNLAWLAGAGEYADCIPAEGVRPPPLPGCPG